MIYLVVTINHTIDGRVKSTEITTKRIKRERRARENTTHNLDRILNKIIMEELLILSSSIYSYTEKGLLSMSF